MFDLDDFNFLQNINCCDWEVPKLKLNIGTNSPFKTDDKSWESFTNIGGTAPTLTSKKSPKATSITDLPRSQGFVASSTPDAFTTGASNLVSKYGREPYKYKAPTAKKESSKISSGNNVTKKGAKESLINGGGTPWGAIGEAAGGVTNALLSGFGNKKYDKGAYNGDPYKKINEKDVKGGSAMSGAGTGAKLGFSIPGGPLTKLIGGLVGAGVGAGIGAKQGGKRYNEMVKQQKLDLRDVDTEKRFALQDDLTKKSNAILMANKGGILKSKYEIPKFEYTPKSTENLVTRKVETPIFKRGGVIDGVHNIIPNGVSHEEENKLGNKGMPVVKCKKDSCEKVYEIESDELILTYDTTKKIEELSKNKDYEALGEFLMDQILDNTHSYTSTYKFLNEK